MERQEVKPPQELADAHTLLAQRYAGYFIGHPYRGIQWNSSVKIDRRRKWKEPSVIADNCIFCITLNNEQAFRRVAGFQFQIDIECTRTKYRHIQDWLQEGIDIPNPGKGHRDWANLRYFIELRQDIKTDNHPDGWYTRPLPLYKLPVRLKRKLCIEWNHCYTAWLVDNPDVHYDFAGHMFYREVEDSGEED